MATTTLDQPTTIAPAEPLTAAQEDALILLAASTDKPARVKAGRATSESRAWSLGGNVD